MARYALIPLKFQEMDKGLERELMIDRESKDLYVLDDYKIPLSITAIIRDDIEGLDDKAKELYMHMKSLEGQYYEKLIHIFNLEHDLDELIYLCETDLFKRIEKLVKRTDYLEERLGEIKESFEDIKKYMDEILNKYKEDLDKILDMIEAKYRKAKSLLDLYKQWIENYRKKIEELKKEIKEIDDKLKLKLDKLGKGKGSFNGKVKKTRTVKYTMKCTFHWLSDNTTSYPGRDDPPGSGNAICWHRYDESIPDRPNFFAARRSFQGELYCPEWDREKFTSAEESWNTFNSGWITSPTPEPNGNQNTYSIGPTQLVSLYWDGVVVEMWAISHTSLLNQFGRNVILVYEYTTTEEVEESFEFDV